MRNKALGLFVLLCLTTVAAEARDIRVRLEKSLSTVTIRGMGIRLKVDGEERLSGLPLINRLVIRRSAGVFIIEPFSRAPEGGEVTTLTYSGRVVELQGEMLSGFPRRLRVHAQGNASFDLIGLVSMEDYIRGVVASEMPSSWPVEALKAQAVASRSYAEAVIGERVAYPFDVESTIHDQVFDLSKLIQVPARYRAKVEAAVNSTAGQNLYFSDGSDRVWKTFYHADCGGTTEAARFVWGARGQGATDREPATVRDSGCALPSRGNWKFEVSRKEVFQKLAAVFPELREAGRTFLDLQILGGSRSESERWNTIVLRSGEWETEINSNRFREYLGFMKLKSTRFDVQAAGEKFVFSGRGFGHGVGMCQMGARLMALGGASYREILRRYFPEAQLRGAGVSDSQQ